jgi:Flp pilus assembly pilin Flp
MARLGCRAVLNVRIFDPAGGTTYTEEDLPVRAFEPKMEVCMLQYIRNFGRDERGQDLIEYTLLVAFVALGAAAIFSVAGRNVEGVWKSANTMLAAANTAAS